MTQLRTLKKHLREGTVYRRNDLTKWSNAVDRHLEELLAEGTLQKLSQGLYYYPKNTAFGKTPPKEKELIASFLKDKNFLLTTPNAYNSLGVGTTQLYNKRIVFNHKRHGEFQLGNRTFEFRLKHYFPKKLSKEFLIVDLVNNLKTLAEDPDDVLAKIYSKIREMDSKKLKSAIAEFGTVKTKKLLTKALMENS